MAAKILFALSAQILLVQVAFGQYIGNNAFVKGNSVVNNDISFGGLNGYRGSGLGAYGGYGASGFGGQYVGSNSVVQGNSVVDNEIVLGGLGLGAGASGYAASGFGGFALGGASVAAPLSFSDATLASLGGYNVVSGSPLIVRTISPLAPSGLAVVSENSLIADLIVSGQLPFLSAVAFEGELATSGAGAASCGCGSGAVGINSASIGKPNMPSYGPIGIY